MQAPQAPTVRYLKNGEVNIAYGVIGDGPFDIVFVSGWVLTTLHEVAWEGPAADFLRRLGSFSRVILFDKRGTGLSDRAVGIPNLETRMDDVRAVMDAVGSKRAAIVGVSEGGPMTILFAASHPERSAAAVLYGTSPCNTRKDDIPWEWTREEYLRFIEAREQRWGEPDYIDSLLAGFTPSMAHDEAGLRWWRRWVLASTSPGAVLASSRMNIDIDVRHVLPTIRVPTFVIHRAEDAGTDVRNGRYIAQHVPGAEYIELAGRDHGWWFNPEPIAQEVERVLTNLWSRGEWDLAESDRILATVLFTDIVGSTAKAAELGDRRWKDLLERHRALVRRQLTRYRGSEVDTAGDGFLATFDGPARAIRCASAIAKTVKELGIEVRAGLHTGECEKVDGGIGGIAVHIGARVAAQAGPGEVLVSNTVRDLVAGSGLNFRDRGVSSLRGVPGEWRLFSVEPVAAELAAY